MLLAIGMIGASETMNLGVKLGMDPKLLAGILNTSTGRNWVSVKKKDQFINPECARGH